MAKKRKTKKRTNSKVEESNNKSAFFDYSISVGLILVGLFVLIGGFGTGGTLPVGLFHGGYWSIGWAAYALPIVLIYLGAFKFATEKHKLPIEKIGQQELVLR